MDKLAMYNACFNTIDEYCKDESWTEYKLCQLPSCPDMTDHDNWLEQFFIDKIIKEDWKNDQLLIDAVTNGHHRLFCTMFNLAKNKNPSRPSRVPRGPPDTALTRASGAGDLEAVKMILKTVPTIQPAKVEALFTAGLLNRFGVFQYLFEMFKDKNPSRGPQGRTLLHEAASLGCIETFKIVLDQVENKNPKDNLGNTPLHLAILFGHIEIVRWIFKHHPEAVGVINANGKTPVDIAKLNPYGNDNSQTVLQMLSEFPFFKS